MSNQVVTSNLTLEQVISNGLNNGEDITINSGAVVTCTRTPTRLIGRVTINNGELHLNGLAISAGNVINFVGEYQMDITVNGAGRLRVTGGWYEIGTTNGTSGQTFDLSTYWGSVFVDHVPMIQVETGRRIYFDGAVGETPVAGDFVRKTSNPSVLGKIISVALDHLIVRYLTGVLADNDPIHVEKVVDVVGPLMDISWTALVNNAAGDIKEADVYQEFGNSRALNTEVLTGYHAGVGGFVFDNAFQSTTLKMPTSAGGFIPPSGCKVRIPNVHFSTSNLANYAANNTYHDNTTTIGNKYNLVTSSGGTVALHTCNLGSVYFSCATPYLFDARYVGVAHGIVIDNSPNVVYMERVVMVPDPLISTYINLVLGVINTRVGGSFKDCMRVRSSLERGVLGARDSASILLDGCIHTWNPVLTGENTTAQDLIYCVDSADVTVKNAVLIGANNANSGSLAFFQNVAGVTLEGVLFSCTAAETAATGSAYSFGFYFNLCRDGMIKGLQLLGSGRPSARLGRLQACHDVKVRAIGRIDNKMSIIHDMWLVTGPCSGIDAARVFKTGGASSGWCFTADGSNKGIKIQNCSGNYDAPFSLLAIDDMTMHGFHAGSQNLGGAGILTSYSGAYGRQIHDGFRSDTAGFIVMSLLSPSAAVNFVTVLAGAPVFQRNGALDVTNGDVLVVEMDYFAMGHSSFNGGFSATKGGAAWGTDAWTNIAVDFQYDVGAGWNGVWLNARTSANLTGITGMVDGIKVKFRITANTTTTGLTTFALHTDTSLAAQKANLYPVDQVFPTISVAGMVAGSIWIIHKVSGGAVVASGTTVDGNATIPYSDQDTPVDLVLTVRNYPPLPAPAYKEFRAEFTLGSDDYTVPVTQELD